MASTRSTLKGYFNAGDEPTEAQFVELIDGLASTRDDNFMTGSMQVTGSVTLGSTFAGGRRLTQTVTDLGGSGGGISVIDLVPGNSGIITLVPALTGGTHTFELPAAADAVGATYTFVATATVGQDFDVTTNGSEKILGATAKGDGDNVAASQAYDSVGFDENAVIGSRFSVTCISSTAGTAFIAHDILDGLAANTGGINLK